VQIEILNICQRRWLLLIEKRRKIKKNVVTLNFHINMKTFPNKSGWYWILIDGYYSPTPCWFDLRDNSEDNCFLPGGLGDSSSMGIYINEITSIGPEIIVPKF